MGPDGRRGSSRRGAALAVVLLLLLAMTALGHGVLLLARRELAASRAGQGVVRARLAAQSAVRLLAAMPPPPGLDSVPVWGLVPGPSGALTGTGYRGALRRLSRERWMLQGWGRGPGDTEVGVGRTAWILDPVARVVSAIAVVTAGPEALVQVEGTVEGESFTATPSGLPAAVCADWQPALDSLVEPGGIPPVGVAPDWARERDALAVGPLAAADLLRRLPEGPGGSGAPAPTEELGECATGDPWNWGDPDRPYRPCGTHLPARAVEGDLVMEGGVGQGLLLVMGDLILRGEARFHGLVLVGGALTVREGARIEGVARVGAGLHVGPDSRIAGSACRALRALAAARPLLGVPVFDAVTGWISLR